MRSAPFLCFAIGLAATTACSSMSLEDLANDTANGVQDTAIDPDHTETDGETDTPAPEYWRLDGVFTVAAGEIVPEESALHIDYWAGGASLCTTVSADTDSDAVVSGTDVVITTAASAASPQDLPLLGLWTVQLAEGNAPCPRPIPTQPIYLGIGPMDARLYPAMGADGFADPAAAGQTLYAAYAGRDPTALALYGLAGTEGQYAGSAAAVVAGPVADGTYRITSLHLLPIAQ